MEKTTRPHKRKFSLPGLLLVIPGLLLALWGVFRLTELPDRCESAVKLDASAQSLRQEARLLAALSAARQTLPAADWTAWALKSSETVVSGGRKADSAVIAAGSGWREIYHRTLLEGRTIGEDEITEGKPVAIADAELCFALWGDRERTGGKVEVNGREYTVVGVFDSARRAGETWERALFIPLKNMPFADTDMQFLAAKNAGSLAMFASAAQEALAGGGQAISLSKEKSRALLPLRYLAVFVGLCFAPPLLRRVTGGIRKEISRLREKREHVYAGKLIFLSLPCVLRCLLRVLLAAGFLYGLVRLALEPAYVFPEWIPENPSDPESFLAVFREFGTRKAALTEYASPLKRYAESCGRFVKAGCVMMLLGIAQNAFGMLTARNKSGM